MSDRKLLALSLADRKALDRWFPPTVPDDPEERFKVEYAALIAFAKEAVRTIDEHDRYTPIKNLPLEELQYLYIYFAMLLREDRVLSSKSRQVLASWATYVYAEWRCLRYRNQKGALVPKKKEDGESHIEERFKALVANHPKFLRDLIEIAPLKGAFIITRFRGRPWNSRVISYPQGPAQLRQHVFSFIIWDEAAHQPKMQESWQAAAPTIQSRGDLRGQVILISSAKPRSYMQQIAGEPLKKAVAIARGVAEPEGRIVRPMQGVAVYRLNQEGENGFAVICIHDTADRLKRSPEWREREAAVYPGGVNSVAWQEEHEMNWWADDQLRTYWAYDPKWSLVPPFDIPVGWPISLGVDFGSTDPTAIIFFAQNPETSELVGFDEIYCTKTAIKDICREIYQRLSKRLGMEITPINIGEFLEDAIGDPSGAGYALEYAQEPWPVVIRTKLVVKGQMTRKESSEASVNSALCPSLACCGKRWYATTCGDCNGKRQGDRQPKPLLTFMAGRCPNLERTMPELVRAKPLRPGLEPDEKDDTGQEDHACMTGGTLVRTPTGLAPLDSLRPGDLVETRLGPRRVTQAAMTGKDREIRAVVMSDGGSLLGTPDHPVWVVGKGMTRIDALRYGDILLPWQPRSSSSAESDTGATQSLGGAPTGFTTRVAPAHPDLVASTKPFGWRRTAQSLLAIISTIGMAIRSTTLLKIWSAFRAESISLVTAVTRLGRNFSSTLRESVRWPSSGIAQRLAGHGIASTEGAWASRYSSVRWYVSSAGGGILEVSREGATARITAAPPLVVPAASTMRRGSAGGAGPSSESTAINVLGIAPSRAPVVLAVQPAGRADVYNITVDEAHEYYASGVLVSNCDATRYRVRAAFFEVPPEAQKRDILNTPSRLLRNEERIHKIILRKQHEAEMERLSEGDPDVLIAHGNIVEVEDLEDGDDYSPYGDAYGMGLH